MLFICYSKCSTCKKARNWLDENGVAYEWRDIKENRLNKSELKKWHIMSGLPLKRFFNTSGIQYRALGLKDKIPHMSEEEQYDLLSTDGLLVKRPILVGENFVLVGFKEEEWKQQLK